jgi:enoyl-CoA hydratase/carnithine racemase
MNERVSIRESDRVAVVLLNRPEKKNALDLAMFEGIVAAAKSLAARRDIRAVVLSGAGGSFCAGLDIANMPQMAGFLASQGGLLTRSDGHSNLFQAAAMVWAELSVPVIAAIEGHAFGGGFQIVLGADIRISAPDAMFSVAESKWGLVPDMGGMVLMPRLARADVIRRLTYTAEVFGAQAALDWGFVTELAEDPMARAMELAQAIAGKSPDAIRAAKKLISETAIADVETALLAESAAQQTLVGTYNQTEAVMAGMAKRAPRFKD